MINFGLLEASGVDFGSIFELFLSHFGASERLWEATLEREPGGAQKVRKIANTPLEFQLFFLLRFVCFFIPSGGGGASTHLEKPSFRMEGIAFFACAFFGAQRKRIELQDKLPTKTRPDGEAKNKRQSIIE